ncbi:hypothetical protein NA57DRAFT_81093 [Rhizodiscina lignyota]|uniref:Uncharacterized protein n=1 Tax=Rhizodiscina lignyota TaxID=1504668 RepID=A0A9P4I234_9PEZI|nr:hypothetical protein NA57DRAFT_81093 [Rhizodiscina lignyota]
MPSFCRAASLFCFILYSQAAVLGQDYNLQRRQGTVITPLVPENSTTPSPTDSVITPLVTADPTTTMPPTNGTTPFVATSPTISTTTSSRSDVILPLLPAAPGVQCFQPEPSDAPSADDLGTLIDNAILATCLGGTFGSSYCDHGYCFFQVSGQVASDADTCADSFRNITEQCVKKGFYGGQVVTEGQLYNLTSKAFPDSPLGDGPYPISPEAPPLPAPADDCPAPFGGAVAFPLTSEQGQTTISMTLDKNTFPQLFSQLTQWRIYTVVQTDIKSWDIQFVGVTGPAVSVSDPPSVVASFEIGDDESLPLKIEITGTISDGLKDNNPVYNTTLIIEGTVGKPCNGQLPKLPPPAPTTGRPSRDQIEQKCDQLNSAVNIASDFPDFWDAANGTGGLQDIKTAFPGSNFAGPIDQFTVNFFHANQVWDCGLVQDDCGAGLNCDEADTPAGFVILQSYSGFHNYLNTLVQAISNAAADSALGQGTFTSTFTVQVQAPQDFTKQILDVVVGIVGVATAGIGFAAGTGILLAKEATDVAKKAVDKGASAISAATSASIAIAKDSLPTEQQAWLAQNDIESGLQQFIIKLSETYSSLSKGLFSDGFYQSAAGQNIFLSDIIDNGVWLADPWRNIIDPTTGVIDSNVDSVDVAANFRKIFYSQMVKIAWSPAADLTNEVFPAIIQYDSSDQVDKRFTDDLIVNYNGKVYALFGAGPFSQGPMPGGSRKTLTGDSTVFGGLTIDDLVISSVEGFNAHGNGFNIPQDQPSFETAGGQTSNIPFSDGVRAPGFVSFPVCTFDDWWGSIQPLPFVGSVPLNYPCNKTI